MAKYVLGVCSTAAEAQNLVDGLTGEGYPRDSITLLAERGAAQSLKDAGLRVESDIDYDASDETVWERIKGFFGFDEEDGAYSGVLAGHRQDIADGKMLVVVDDATVPAHLRDDLANRDTGYWNADKSTDADNDTLPDRAVMQDKDEDETIRLEAERLNVDKQSVKAGDVVVKKRVVEETQTVNVPVMHEEVVIERRPVTGNQAAADADFTEETINIPLWEEKVNVSKQPVVTEEVHIGKNDVEDTRQVSASLRKEELDVDKTGNVVLRDTNNGAPAQRP